VTLLFLIPPEIRLKWKNDIRIDLGNPEREEDEDVEEDEEDSIEEAVNSCGACLASPEEE